LPEVVATNGDSELPSKVVAVSCLPDSGLAGAAVPGLQVADTAAFAEPKMRELETSSPRLPIAPSFLSLLMADPHCLVPVLAAEVAGRRV
jgi:hypothetical protein